MCVQVAETGEVCAQVKGKQLGEWGEQLGATGREGET